jgi:SAM-dependent methyltransferase
MWRNSRLPSASHYEFCRAVVDDIARSNPDFAVGSDSSESWMAVGQLQFDYLIKHGLAPHHRFLDIGCGNLRLGWRVIRYLDAGCYTGLDLSPVILKSARTNIMHFHLEEKLPALHLVNNADYPFLPSDHFDRVYAHGVFTQTPIEIIREVLASIRRVLKPGSIFEFTFHATDGPPRSFLREDFYHPPATVLDAVHENGMVPTLRTDWNYSQAKVWAKKPLRQHDVPTASH